MSTMTARTAAPVDVRFMRRALRLAARGRGWTSPNPMVGAVVVRGDEIVGEGYHRAVGGPHAEVHALRAAGAGAAGATLYVTLEPCNHFGRTPPCTQAVLEAGIRRVVTGMLDPNPRVAGHGAERLRAAGVQVEIGVLEADCRRLNQPFIKAATTGIPYLVMKTAATLDGRIAARSGDARWVTNDRSRRFGHRLRHQLDAVLVGIGTVLADDPLLTARLGRVKCRQPVRVIADTHLRLPETSGLVHSLATAPLWVVCSGAADAAREARLREAGLTVIRVAETNGRVDLEAALTELGRRGIASVLVEGGAHLLGSLLDAGLVDFGHFFFAPKVLGDAQGVPMVSGRCVDRMAAALPVYDLAVRRFGGDVLVSGRFRPELY